MKSILLVRTDRIGDVVLSLPMLPVLRRRFPSARITVMVRPYTRELVQHHPCVDEVLLWQPENGNSFMDMVRLLRSRSFDVAIIPYPRFRIASLIFLAGIRIRIATGYRWYSFLFNRKVYEHRKDAKRHETEYNLHLLSALGIEWSGTPEFDLAIAPSAQRSVDDRLRRDGLEGKRFAVLHAGSGGSARDWPLRNFAALGDLLAADGTIAIVLTGGADETDLVGRLAAMMTVPVHNYSGKFSLEELGALFRRAAVFVSNSTGPLHIAAAVGTAVVAFYPPIIQCSARRWGPVTEKKMVFTADAARCPLCRGGACRGNVCMEQIAVGDVADGIRKLIGT